MKQTLFSERGFTLLHCLAAMLVSGLLAGAALNTIRLAGRSASTVERRFNHQQSRAIVRQQVERAVRSATLYHGIPTVSVHPDPLRATDAHSAVHFLNLSSSLLLYDLRFSANAVEACLAERVIGTSLPTVFLAAGLDGYSIAAASRSRRFSDPRCPSATAVRLQLSAPPPQLAALVEAAMGKGNIEFPRLLFPIDDAWLLYADRDNTLRRLGTISGEQQPIIQGVAIERTAIIRSPNGEQTLQLEARINNEREILYFRLGVDSTRTNLLQ